LTRASQGPSWRRRGRDGYRCGATSGVRITHPKIANWGRSIRSSGANRLVRSQESHRLGHRQRPDRGPKQKYRPAGPATAELSPIAAMTVVRRLVTERGGACQRRKLADRPAMGGVTGSGGRAW
jgi:hypothetical protein